MEPYESEGKIASVEATSADSFDSPFKRWREYRFFFSGMDAEKDKLSVIMQEWVNGKLVKKEKANKDVHF